MRLSIFLLLTFLAQIELNCQIIFRGDGDNKNKWGLKDSSGNILIEPQFSWINKFVNGYSKVVANGKIGYINKFGRIICEPKYLEGKDFEVNRMLGTIASVKSENGWGILDGTGKELLQSMYHEITPLTDGHSIISKKSSNTLDYGLMDAKLKIVVPLKYRYLKESKDQLLIAYLNKANEPSKQILVTKTGEEVINIPLPHLEYHSPDHYIYNSYGFRKGLLKVSAKKVILPPEFDQINVLSNHQYLVKTTYYYHIYNQEGKAIIPKESVSIEVLEGGKYYLAKLKAINNVNHKYGLFDSSGNSIHIFDEVYKANEKGYLYYKVTKSDSLNNRYRGVINRYGKEIIPTTFYDIMPYSDYSFVVVNKKNESLYERSVYDTTGKQIIPNGKFYFIDRFHNGLAAVKKEQGGKYGFINKKGDLVIPYQYDMVNDFRNGPTAVVTLNGKRVNINSTGKVLSDAVEYNNNSNTVTKDERLSLKFNRLFAYKRELTKEEMNQSEKPFTKLSIRLKVYIEKFNIEIHNLYDNNRSGLASKHHIISSDFKNIGGITGKLYKCADGREFLFYEKGEFNFVVIYLPQKNIYENYVDQFYYVNE